MFHRVKSEPAQQATKGPEQPAAPVSQNPAPQQISAKETLPLNETRPAQQVQTEQNNQQAVKAAAVTATPKKEEAPPMNDQAKKTETQESTPRALEIPGSSAYQRPGQPPVRAAGTFPGAYPGYNPHAGASASAGAAISTDRRLIIGRGITMSGEIESCDHLVVEGTVEATLKGASVLDIAESGVFYGTVEIDEATVAGRFEGDIQVNGRLTIRAGGAIKGSISYKELEVEAGATIDGRLSPVGAEHDAKKTQSRAKKKDSHEAANNDGELFASKQAAE